MTTFQYAQKKNEYLEAQNPFKVIDKRDIQYVGDNIYNLDGHEFEVSPMMAASIDRFIGLKSKQVKAVADVSGDEGVVDYRNYIAMVNSIVEPEKLALVADPKERKIVSAVPLKKNAIPMEGFFDFAEMFCNDNNYTVGSMNVASDVTSGIQMTLVPDTKDVISLGQDEDFMTNGFVLRWNLGAIEAGNYYERLICSNGATEQVFKERGSIHALEENDIKKMLDLPQARFAGKNFLSFRDKAYEAMETRASMSEMRHTQQLLAANGVDAETAEMVIPYQSDVNAYNAAGFSQYDPSQAKGSIGEWELFNRLTFFASHNEIWADDDNRRIALMSASVAFLRRPRDIKEYVDIFAK